MTNFEKFKKTVEQVDKMNAEKRAMLEKVDAIVRELPYNDPKEWKKHLDEIKAKEEIMKDLNARAHEIENLIIIYKENACFYFCEHVRAVMSEILNKYEGKRLGERTYNKMREEAKENGFYMYFNGSVVTCEKWCIEATPCDFMGNAYKVEIYGLKPSNSFVNEENIIQGGDMIGRNRYMFVKNPEKHLLKMEKAFLKYYKATQKAREAQDEYNKLTKRHINRVEEVFSYDFYGYNKDMEV